MDANRAIKQNQAQNDDSGQTVMVENIRRQIYPMTLMSKRIMGFTPCSNNNPLQ